MSYIRSTQNKKYSKNDDPLYAFLSGPHNDLEDYDGPEYFIESYGDLKQPEHFTEIMCRILERADINLTLEEVNKIREELLLDKLDKIPTNKKV